MPTTLRRHENKTQNNFQKIKIKKQLILYRVTNNHLYPIRTLCPIINDEELETHLKNLYTKTNLIGSNSLS